MTDPLHRDAVATLTRFRPAGHAQESLRATYLEHLRCHPDGLTRHCHPDHITASALVVSADRSRVLLNLHRKYGIWVQFGGHCEPGDQTLAAAARRETMEESGIAGLQLVCQQPAQLSTHEVRCGPIRPSHHLDVRFVAVAPAGSEARVSEESLEVRWFDHADLPAGLEPALHELIAIAADG